MPDDMQYFARDIDLDNVDAMREFLANHFRYWTMHSWNGMSSYANDVKLQNLGLTPEQLDRAWEVIDPDTDSSLFWDAVQASIDDFYAETGYTAGFNGRSGGYIVLYECDSIDRDHVLMRGIDQDEDFDDEERWDADDLAERVQLVTRFDVLCDDIRATFISVLADGHIEDYEQTVVVSKKRLVF